MLMKVNANLMILRYPIYFSGQKNCPLPWPGMLTSIMAMLISRLCAMTNECSSAYSSEQTLATDCFSFFLHYLSLQDFKSLIYWHWTKTSHGPVSREIFNIPNTFFQAPPKMESSDLPYGLMRASVCKWNLEANHYKAEDLVHLAEWSA